MKYELLMINVARDYSSYSSSFRDSIGQYLIAGYLRKHDFKSYVFSGTIQNCRERIKNAIECDGVPVVGFYAAADNIRIVSHVVQWIKKQYPSVKTVIGGPQAIALDVEYFEYTNVDYVIIGEGEISMLRLLEHLIDNSCKIIDIPSLLYRDNVSGELIYNQCNEAIIEELDNIPFPVMEDSLAQNLRQGTIAGIITGRGCPYQCSFCYEGANAKKVRFRSIDNVIDEIRYILSINNKLEYISIYDDTFTLKRERVLEFCSKIKPYNLRWFCEGHISFILKNKDILQNMIDSGLSCIQFGIESGSNLVLDAYKKQTNFDMILQGISYCKKAGISGITGNFIIGGALESRRTLSESRKLAEQLINSAKGVIELYVVYLAPYPNTRIVNQPEQFDLILRPELEKYNLNTMRSPVLETKSLSVKEIYEEKKYFEEFIHETYKKAAKYPDKKDVLQGLVKDGKRIHINPTWEKYYLEQTHVVTFLEHISEEEQTFNENKYIIRTFEDVLLDDETMISEVGKFSGIEKDILLNATGIYTALEMSTILSIGIDEIRKYFHALNNKCLVYMSEF